MSLCCRRAAGRRGEVIYSVRRVQGKGCYRRAAIEGEGGCCEWRACYRRAAREGGGCEWRVCYMRLQ